MQKNNSRKKVYFIVAGLVVILALLFMLLFVRPGGGDKAGEGAEIITEQSESAGNEAGETEEEGSSEPLATIFCSSDYQIEEGWDTPAQNLEALINSAVRGLAEERKTGDSEPVIDAVINCGDYTNDRKLHDYQLSPEDSIAEIREVSKACIPEFDDDNMIFVQGNHDALTESITPTGLHEYNDYLVYVLNTENDFPWKQGKVAGSLKKVKAAAADLGECLDKLTESGETRPLIIAGHVPLHFTARTSSRHSTGDNLYSSLIFNEVNEAGKDLDIIYLFGHNHSKGWDCYMGGGCVYKAAGDTLLIPKFEETDVNTDTYTEETLNFTYLNAGYTGYYMNCGPDELDNGTWHDYDAADTALTGTTLEIYTDKIVITRWDSEGVHNISGNGEGDPYKGGIDAGLIPESEYNSETGSPQEIARKQ